MKERLGMAFLMGKGYLNIKMGKVILDVGKIIKGMDKENIIFQMGILIMENLKKICLMGEGLCFILMEIKL